MIAPKAVLNEYDKLTLTHLAHPGDIHSIEFPDGGRFIRVTGTDLDTVDQRIYNLADKSVKVASAAAAIDDESRGRG